MPKSVLIALSLATPVAAQTAPAPAPAPVVKPADKPICRYEQQTGSIMPGRKTCHTKAEWRAIDDASANAVGAYRDHASGGGMNPN